LVEAAEAQKRRDATTEQAEPAPMMNVRDRNLNNEVIKKPRGRCTAGLRREFSQKHAKETKREPRCFEFKLSFKTGCSTPFRVVVIMCAGYPR
jgi:hypothetical protein